ncbi:MAG: pentapeptide repeat-containing protein [Myxococcota bacterium]
MIPAPQASALPTLRAVDPSPAGPRADLRGAELARAPLSGDDLSGADLREAKLAGADLRGACLVHADLRGADLSGALLDGAELLGAKLEGANLEGAQARQAGFGGASLRGIRGFGLKAPGASFVGAVLDDADLRSAELEGATLTGAQLKNAELTRAVLREADLVGAEARGARFVEVDFRGARLRGLRGFARASFLRADVRDVDFAGAYLVRRHILDENYLEEFRAQSRWHRVLYTLWWLSSDCGRSLGRWALLLAGVVALFGRLFAGLPLDYAHATPLAPYYFSLVTLTTLGFGEIVPSTTTGQALVMVEVSIGYLLLGGMLSIFTNKMARRAE